MKNRFNCGIQAGNSKNTLSLFYGLNEAARLFSVHRTRLLDTPPDPRFDTPMRLAARFFDVPIALVSLMDSERQWFKAAVGFPQGGGTRRSDAFCAYTILDPTQPLIVKDVLEDERFAANPLVTGPEGIRFYAGAPILDAEGHALGSLCILDTRPRHLSPEQIETLIDLASGVSTILQMEQAAAAQQESEEHHRWAVTLSPQTQWVADAAGHILEIGPRLLQQLGATLAEVSGHGWIRKVPLEEHAFVEKAWRHSLQTGELLDLEFHLSMTNGSRRWVRSRGAPRRNDNGEIIRWYGTIEDIDSRKQTEMAVRETQQRLEFVLDSTSDYVAFLDHQWRATYLNCHLRRINDHPKLPSEVLWELYPDLVGTEVETGLRHAQESGLPVALERYSPRLGGWVNIHAYPTAQGISLFMRDTSEQHRLNEQLLHQAHHDSLTGLPNRSFLQNTLHKRLEAQVAGGAGTMLLRLRLNNFRAATDTFGPALGETLMRCVAGRLTQFVAAGCFVACLGGPEFAVLPSSGPEARTPELLANQLLDVLERPYILSDSTVRLRLSVGIASTPDDAQTADKLLQAAEIAMSRARRDGGQGCQRFSAGLLKELEDRHQLLLDLREAVADGQLSLAYQPLIDLPQNRIGGFEALMRWTHPKRGIVSPAEFIPVAEQGGLMMELGAFALRQACEDAKRWHEPVRVAVNLSPIQFRDPDLVATIARTLKEVGISPSRLKLEITETVLLDDSDANLNTLHKLRALGVMIVLDDFGTGYSSLGYLQKFPFHKLKIDQSFVRPLLQRPDCQAIVRSILDLARALGMDTTAEGVETPEQLEWMSREGCGQVQGYLLGRPMPTGQVNKFLHEFVYPSVEELN